MGDQRGERPCGDVCWRPPDTMLGEQLIDDQLLDRAGPAPERHRPVREPEAPLAKQGGPLRGISRSDLLDDRRELLPERSGLVWKVDAELSTSPFECQPSDHPTR